MTKDQFAAMLEGREYRNEMSRAEEKEAAGAGLVVVFGASDDLMELRGAISDEYGCYDGGTVKVDAKGLLTDWEQVSDDGEEAAEDYFKRKPHCKAITANWDTDGYSWTYTTNIPHATFNIMEDGEMYCRGIVFNVSDLADREAK